jgi:AbrB family looped-hinge helix DNA binding protein
MNIVKSVRISKKGQFVIPKEMRKALGVKEGEELLVTFEAGKIVLTRPQEYAKTTRGLLKGTWGKNRRSVEQYIAKERRAWEQGHGVS